MIQQYRVQYDFSKVSFFDTCNNNRLVRLSLNDGTESKSKLFSLPDAFVEWTAAAGVIHSRRWITKKYLWGENQLSEM